MSNIKILWADDEIDLLKPHILFLNSKGYEVETVTNGRDAIDTLEAGHFDMVILDENMPGISGLETLQRIKIAQPAIPVIMITKSEEENIMNQAVGSSIADYLIKPVNPMQILLSIKKNLHSDDLVKQQVTLDYRKQFGDITMRINNASTIDDWYDIYSTLVRWEITLAGAETGMYQMIVNQRDEANSAFAKFVRRNYERWHGGGEHPLRSDEIFKTAVLPLLDAGKKVCFVVIDNFRLDQWKTIQPAVSGMFNVDRDVLYTSILPTTTQYARNAIFSGLMPAQIKQMYPDLWIEQGDDDGKNVNEAPLVQTFLDRFRRRIHFSYNKVADVDSGERLVRNIDRLDNFQLNVIVLNFVDMLSHTRTESKMIRELAGSDAAYRDLTESWFRNSYAQDLFRGMAARGFHVVLTTDHGTIMVDNPIKIVGDKNTNTNLRYKLGKSLSYNPRQVYEITRPATVGLPSPNVSSAYVFAMNHDFFAYPNNYNYYVQYYGGTFQHGGISMEEMLVPLVSLSPK